MRSLFIFFTFVLLTQVVYGQNRLEIKNSNTGKTRHLKQGAKLHFKTKHDSTFIKAKIVLIKDSVIVFYIPEFEDEMPLMDVAIKDISEIQKASLFHSITRGLGSIGLPIGSFLLVDGGLRLLRNDSGDNGETTKYTLLGLGIAAVSTIPYFIKPNKYKSQDGWEFKVVKKQ